MVVVGAGRSGLACARTLAREGRRVVLVDRSDTPAIRERVASLPDTVEVRLGGYPDDVASGALMVCPSPGVPWNAPELEVARAQGVPVRSEMDLVFERCRARICGITGTNGKTTTTALVAAILERAGERVHLGGNIGVTMLDRLDSVSDSDWVVLELSSFQIESVREPRCAIACVLNVTPDHLDRHGDFATYAETKRRLVRFALDDAVLGFDDLITREMSAVATCRVRYFGVGRGFAEGATRIGEDVVSVDAGSVSPVLPVHDIPLFGEHNLQNVLAAVAVARAAGVPTPPIAVAVRDFHTGGPPPSDSSRPGWRALGQRQQSDQCRSRRSRRCAPSRTGRSSGSAVAKAPAPPSTRWPTRSSAVRVTQCSTAPALLNSMQRLRSGISQPGPSCRRSTRRSLPPRSSRDPATSFCSPRDTRASTSSSISRIVAAPSVMPCAHLPTHAVENG